MYAIDCLAMDTILAEIEDYLTVTGMSATAFGRAAVSSPNFVFRLRRDEDFMWSSVKRARQYMAENPPKPESPQTIEVAQ